jgi:transcriptional regulator with XRE-family HTH domain
MATDVADVREWRQGMVCHPYLGPNLKRLRRARGLSREELAVKVGIGAQTLKNYETRRTEPTVSMFVRLAQELAVDLNSLVRPS